MIRGSLPVVRGPGVCGEVRNVDTEAIPSGFSPKWPVLAKPGDMVEI